MQLLSVLSPVVKAVHTLLPPGSGVGHIDSSLTPDIDLNSLCEFTGSWLSGRLHGVGVKTGFLDSGGLPLRTEVRTQRFNSVKRFVFQLPVVSDS